MFVPRSVSKGGVKKPSVTKPSVNVVQRDKNVIIRGNDKPAEEKQYLTANICQTNETKAITEQYANAPSSSENSEGSRFPTEDQSSTTNIRTGRKDSTSSFSQEVNSETVLHIANEESKDLFPNKEVDLHILNKETDLQITNKESTNLLPNKEAADLHIINKETDLHLPNKESDLHLPNKESDGDDIISYSKDQRWPEPGEPVCVMCGRYAEYICEQTDVDVCSLECKAKHLAQRNEPNKSMDMTVHENLEVEKTEERIVDKTAMSELNLYEYKDHAEITQLREEQIEELRTQLGIKIQGNDVPKPILEFRHLSLSDKLNDNLKSAGYELPTAVQMQVIPTFLCHRDMMISAHTSTGKTVSFLLPSIVHIQNHTTCSPGIRDPLVLVLSPTRELCMQIEEQAKELMQGLPNMRTALLVGGLPMPTQLYRLRKGVQFVVATPGRLQDIIDKEGISLSSLKIVIIDEVDTMLHMGFQEQVMGILKDCPETIQTMLCSATIPQSIEKMASMLLSNPVRVSVGEPSMPNEAVRQIIIWVEEPSKKKKLYSILQDPKHFKPPMVVFVESRVGADMLAASVYKVCGLNCLALHGDKQQKDRSAILTQFLEGNIPVLVCTGLVGRGIDFPKVKMVINFDMPTTVEQYIHQVGRAGRLGERGVAITFINNGSKYLFLDFVRMLQTQNVTMPTELVNSPHLHHQQQKRKMHSKYHQHRNHGSKKRKGQWDEESDSD